MTPTQAILLVNLGSPAAPTPRAVRAFLAEFLGDPLVVDGGLVWWLVRNLIVLPFRSPKSAKLYESVWTPEGSPLIAISERQKRALAERIGDRYVVELAMRYGEPSVHAALARLAAAGVTDVTVVPMFPQASRTTTETVFRHVRDVAREVAGAPRLHELASYFEHPAYVEAVRASADEHLARSAPVEHVVMSLHGLPVRYVANGDPYQVECERSAELVARALGLTDGGWTLAYQSRFGREPWLEPNTEDVLVTLAAEHRRVAVLCPGFVCDCLETIEEIGIRAREVFTEAGGDELVVVPCLNDHPAWIDALATIVDEHAEAR